jgi:predicted ATPase
MLQPIIGRERELGRLRAALDDATPSASAIVLRAPAGAGKTTLWAAAVSFAVERRRRVLEARPSAAEARLSYSALADLFASTPGAAWGQLPSPQRRALEIALLRVNRGVRTLSRLRSRSASQACSARWRRGTIRS